jgi:hypothetical protein
MKDVQLSIWCNSFGFTFDLEPEKTSVEIYNKLKLIDNNLKLHQCPLHERCPACHMMESLFVYWFQ